ncbi:hypothetical protein PAXINDRAFT_82209 [Paxillus involutus ATCC 200175]|uniref:Uncharacterized protein n=1 Tax=Paxillus involutus ATCC 200175 TaxID=664439 RepID=A0A0C9SUJ9_PAXIN|nr:hypothetical protein PAXINDRAFT_82209 [Paxillus involutus ATCC 200175]
MTLPVVEAQPQELLGELYVDDHWQAALAAVMNAEGDTTQASTAVEKLAATATHRTGLTFKIPASCPPLQLTAAEEQLKDSMKMLKDCNHIIGTSGNIHFHRDD